MKDIRAAGKGPAHRSGPGPGAGTSPRQRAARRRRSANGPCDRSVGARLGGRAVAWALRQMFTAGCAAAVGVIRTPCQRRHRPGADVSQPADATGEGAMAFSPLSERSDFTFPPGTFDVRNWDVKTAADEEKVGKVKDVLLDESGNARYLVVHLGVLGKHILLPIGQARVDEKEDVVWVPGMTKDRMEHVPEYEGDPKTITKDYEDRLSRAYTGAYAGERYHERAEHGAGRPRTAGAGRPRTAGAGMGGREGRLASRDELSDFKSADEDPDPRGWDVVGSDGRTIGKVSELIVDTAVMKVRYLTVKVDERELGLEPQDRQILIPIGYARLNEDQEQVFVDAISAEDVSRMPTFGGLPLGREQEEQLHAAYTGGVRGEERFREPHRTEMREGEMHIRRAEEEMVVGKRQVETGEVDIHKEVETEIE